MFWLKSFTLWHAVGLSLMGHAIVLSGVNLELFDRGKIEPATLIQVGYVHGDDIELGGNGVLAQAAAPHNTAAAAPVSVPVPATPATKPKQKVDAQKSKVLQFAKQEKVEHIDPPARAQLRAEDPQHQGAEWVAQTPPAALSNVDSSSPAPARAEQQYASLAGVGPASQSFGGRGLGFGPSRGNGSRGSGDSPVKIVSAPKPPYPADARAFGFEGRVTLHARIGTDGRVKEISVLRSSGRSDCDESAVRVVRDRWKFKPASIDGSPIETEERISVRYALVAD